MSDMGLAATRVAEITAWVDAMHRPPQVTPRADTTFASVLEAATAPVDTTSTNPYGAEIDAAAGRHGIDPRLLTALVRQESGFDPNAVSPAGAAGLTQLMPGTAQGLGVTDATDPAQALEGGAKYLREMLDRFGGDVSKALAAYNAGPSAVERHGGIPPYDETQAYVRNVLKYAGQAGHAAGPAPIPTFAPASVLPYSTT